MSSGYEQLLGATIQHLEDLKERGERHVAVSQETLRALAQPVTMKPAASLPPHPSFGHPLSHSERGSGKVQDMIQPMPAALTPSASDSVPCPPAPASDKAAAFAALQSRVLNCVRCPHLVSSRKTVVFGVGDVDSPLMFVGEAPGADEDEQGEPFVGKAGQLLTKIIQAMGLSRGEVYIANILKCRPDTPGESAGNRKPRPDEMATCIPYLHEQIDLIRPRVLVALGATALEGLLGKTIGISRLRGSWQTYRNIPLMPTYHPAYLLRNQAMSEKRKVWEDMLQVMEKLALPVSDKQRNYFLKA